MNARQAKKYRKKVVVPFFMMDEMCLISMTEEEQKEYFKARKKFMERYCQYKHYRDKDNIDNIRQNYYAFPWPIGEVNKNSVNMC